DGTNEFGVADPELGHHDERSVHLSQLLADVGDKIIYSYHQDMTEEWEHYVTLEKILPADAGVTGVVCTAGQGACPPEDCGGIGSYEALKATLADPDADGH